MLFTRHEINTFYNHLTLHIVPGPRSLSYSVPFLLTIGALLIPPWLLSHRQIRWLVIPTIYSVQMYVWSQHRSFDVISMNMALTAFMLLGWYDVRRDFRYIRWLKPCERSESEIDRRKSALDGDGDSAMAAAASTQPKTNQNRQYVLESYPSAFGPRLKWTLILFSSMRLTNWRIGTASHDARQPFPIGSFKAFTLNTLWHTLFCYLLLDLTSGPVAEISRKHDLGGSLRDSLVNRSVQALTLMGHFYAGLALYNGMIPHLLSIGIAFVAPSLKYNAMVSPLVWPSHFGPLSSIYSTSQAPPQVRNRGLRAFWGTFWHQNMRHITSTPGVALASILGFDSQSRIRYMIIVSSGFFWSGIVHMGVVPPEPLGTQLSSWEMRIRVASFFWLQIIGIGIEQLTEYMLETNSPEAPDKQSNGKVMKKSKRPQNSMVYVEQSFILAWTAAFLTITAWLTVFPVGSEMGWWKLRLVPVSILGLLLNRYR